MQRISLEWLPRDPRISAGARPSQHAAKSGQPRRNKARPGKHNDHNADTAFNPAASIGFPQWLLLELKSCTYTPATAEEVQSQTAASSVNLSNGTLKPRLACKGWPLQQPPKAKHGIHTRSALLVVFGFVVRGDRQEAFFQEHIGDTAHLISNLHLQAAQLAKPLVEQISGNTIQRSRDS